MIGRWRAIDWEHSLSLQYRLCISVLRPPIDYKTALRPLFLPLFPMVLFLDPLRTALSGPKKAWATGRRSARASSKSPLRS
ncbi:hypothetical protein MPNT_90075 [Candidatus Methylacidithermus pantelleriae]|uniref:Uncharacterized protein n=1 Tax=Candidatus Methylacidithermus pantelleriae TaxID=2744239 RepID=A0A8J2BNR0_9BACT|nr:hypothetical protein MPNT_90075 [Candidatus Methylacidithermus pantelleriae]